MGDWDSRYKMSLNVGPSASLHTRMALLTLSHSLGSWIEPLALVKGIPSQSLNIGFARTTWRVRLLAYLLSLLDPPSTVGIPCNGEPHEVTWNLSEKEIQIPVGFGSVKVLQN